MEAPRAAHREMVDPRNRNVLSTVSYKMIACAQRSIARARDLEIPEKEERVLDFIMMTAGIDGRGREDLRDALAGARPIVGALAGMAQPGRTSDGVPTL